MNSDTIDIPKVSIRPIDCLKEAVNLIKEQYWLFVGITAVGILIGTLVPFYILLGPMMCGIFYCFFKRSRGNRVRFEDLFKGFDFFVESLIISLILLGVMLVISIPLYALIFFGIILNAPSAGEAGFLTIWLMFLILYPILLILSAVIGVLFSLTYPLIVDRGMKAVPALKTSISAATNNFGGLLALLLLIIVIITIAALFCYLPTFLVYPVCCGAMAIAYRRIFPAIKETGESEGSSTVE